MTRVMDYPIQSLRNLSLQEITKQKNIRLYSTDQLWLLPPNLKDPIRGVLLKRGYHNHLEIIKPLLHSNVRSLDLSECNKTEELLHTVLESCGHLRKLNLNCNRDENHIGDGLTELLTLLMKRNGFLCVLSMRNFANVDDYVLRNIPHCLSELDLGGCTGISDKGKAKVMINIEINVLICRALCSGGEVCSPHESLTQQNSHHRPQPHRPGPLRLQSLSQGAQPLHLCQHH